ncbi:hypothetical protein SABR111722_09300 [Saccharibacillus brassicae]
MPFKVLFIASYLIQAGVSYGYDNENNRNSITVNGVTTKQIINPHAVLSQVLMETDTAGTPQARYVYGLGLIGREDAAGKYQTYHYDLRGSTVALTDEQGQVTDTYTYDMYGERLSHEGASSQPFQYNGRDGVQTDVNGLYQMRARYYNPAIKRFVNRDVLSGGISNGLTMNRYAYVNGNPVSYIDPFGLSADGATWWETGLSFAADATPFVGTLKGIQEVFSGVDLITGEQMSVTDRVATGVGTAASLIPFGKFVGQYLAKEGIEGGAWLARKIDSKMTAKASTKTPNHYLNIAATENGTLNIGARGKAIKGAYNIDIDPKSPDVHYGDATNLTSIKTGSQSKIIFENPFGYDPLNSEVLRVLSMDGEISITGSRSNMKKLLKQLDNRGLKIKGELLEVPNDGSYLTTDGETIKSPMLDRFIFMRK